MKQDHSSNESSSLSRSSAATATTTPRFVADEISPCPDGECCHLTGATCISVAYSSHKKTSRRCNESMPVCVCDGVTTYANACVARCDLAERGYRVGFSEGKCQDNVML
eukprot:CAMPEP_0183743316 /NCGR_PEP_ID=MMETSP0737-20130205/65156_1 /TAXON_ID=385413 /ORGANISM="Thalassiosira miniscula, Strain CCMP1093" /LENGTH=108 /DNA_ID=CAMNT_0025978931 /DNA_START=234 /DNA_END=560 /DNA_ORIENTATION=-